MSQRVIIQMKQYFHVVMLYCVLQVGYNFLVWTHCNCVTNELTASKLYFHVTLLILLYKLALNFKSVDKILVFDHSVESY